MKGLCGSRISAEEEEEERGWKHGLIRVPLVRLDLVPILC